MCHGECDESHGKEAGPHSRVNGHTKPCFKGVFLFVLGGCQADLSRMKNVKERMEKEHGANDRTFEYVRGGKFFLQKEKKYKFFRCLDVPSLIWLWRSESTVCTTTAWSESL
jgi:hypothetical protein